MFDAVLVGWVGIGLDDKICADWLGWNFVRHLELCRVVRLEFCRIPRISVFYSVVVKSAFHPFVVPGQKLH